MDHNSLQKLGAGTVVGQELQREDVQWMLLQREEIVKLERGWKGAGG